jgi:hypothetical protein
MARDTPVEEPSATQELSCPFAPAGPAAAGSRPRPKRGYLLPGTIALVVCAVIAVVIDLAGIQSRTPSSLAGRQVEAYLSQSLQYLHPQAAPPQVRCPANEPLRAGLSFDCSLLAAGRPPATIVVTETSASGTFRYRPPAAT